MKIVCFSGLGADERMFAKLSLPYELIHITWLKPKPHEPLQQYCQRIIPLLPEEDFGIMGLSFGGVVAQELAAILKPKFLILISTLNQASDIRWFYHIFRAMPESAPIASLAPLAPKQVINKVFGANKLKTQQLIHSTIREGDPDFIRWAIQQVLRYSNAPTDFTGPILRLHGNQDNLITCPVSLSMQFCITGGHLIIYEQASKVSQIISDWLFDIKEKASI